MFFEINLVHSWIFPQKLLKKIFIVLEFFLPFELVKKAAFPQVNCFFLIIVTC